MPAAPRSRRWPRASGEGDVSADAVELCQIAPTFESLGLVVDLLASSDSFDRYEFGPLIQALSSQISNRHHVCAFRGGRLVGYCGFLPVTGARAALWLDDRAALEMAPHGEAGVLRPMIRFCRLGFPGTRIFFKRNYAGARRVSRKSTVLNRG
jgi:hypothetical protein